MNSRYCCLGRLKLLLLVICLFVCFQLLIFASLSSTTDNFLFRVFQEPQKQNTEEAAKETKTNPDATVIRGTGSTLLNQRVALTQTRNQFIFTNQTKNTMEKQKLRPMTTQFSRLTAIFSKSKPKSQLNSTEKSVDMENDYYPLVNFSFAWPATMPDLKGERDFFLVVLVNSAARGQKYRLRREAVRKTWAKHMTECERLQSSRNPRLGNHKWILVFSLGKAGEIAEDKANAKEAKLHNDILIGEFQDIYINNVIKIFMGKLWVSSMNVRYILKSDDDVFVRIPSIIDFLMSQGYPKLYYGGAPYFNFKVDRDPKGKWAVSKKYFSEEYFPTLCAGAFYVLSTDMFYKLFNYTRQRRPFHTDDAYIGIAARDMNVTVQRIPGLLLEPSMPNLLKDFDDCKLIKAKGYGHDVDPPNMDTVFHRLESLCKKITNNINNTCLNEEPLTTVKT